MKTTQEWLLENAGQYTTTFLRALELREKMLMEERGNQIRKDEAEQRRVPAPAPENDEVWKLMNDTFEMPCGVALGKLQALANELQAERNKLRGFYEEIVKFLGDDLVIRRITELRAERDALQRELAAVTAERDRLLKCQRYCAAVLRDAGHDEAAPLEAMVRYSVAYADRMKSERNEAESQLEKTALNDLRKRIEKLEAKIEPSK